MNYEFPKELSLLSILNFYFLIHNSYTFGCMR